MTKRNKKIQWEPISKLTENTVSSFDIESLIPPECNKFKNLMHNLSEAYQVSPWMVGLPAISVMSLTLCSSVRIKVNESWYEEPPVWCLLMAKSSERKSPVLKEICKPIVEFEKEYRVKYGEFTRKLSRRRGVYKQKITGLEKKLLGANDKEFSEIENEINVIERKLSEIPDFIEYPNIFQSDITPEALVSQTQRNGGISGIISPESEGLANALGLYSNQENLPIYLKGYSGESYQLTRKGSESSFIEKALIVVCVMVQPIYMHELAQNKKAKSSGFIARFLFSIPPSNLGRRDIVPKEIDKDLLNWWSLTLKSTLALPKRKWGYQDGSASNIYTGKESLIYLSDEAKKIFNEERRKNEDMLKAGGALDDETGWGGKLMGNILRIAACLHFISGKSIHDEISEETMRFACRWSGPLIDHYHFALEEPKTGSDIDRRVLGAINKIIKKEVYLSAKTINDLFNACRDSRYKKAADWIKVWERMEGLGYIKTEKGIKGAVNVFFHPEFCKVLR